MVSKYPLFELTDKKIWVAGHRGMVGSALCRRLASENCDIVTASRKDLDLTNQAEVNAWINTTRPDAIFMSAATVGGILANDSRPAEFLYQNLMIESNVIHAAWQAKVSKLLFLGSSCIYPKEAAQPMIEEALLTGPLEPTNQWYAIAKIAGIKMCQAYRKQYGCDFISAQPTNLYGPGDNFDLQSSHVAPALISKIHTAKIKDLSQVDVWGTGNPKREFLYVDDLADALVFQMKHYSEENPVNIGTGTDLSIRSLAETIAHVIGYTGDFRFDENMPDGTLRKLLDVSRLTKMGWTAQTDLKDGLNKAYQWYLQNVANHASENLREDA